MIMDLLEGGQLLQKVKAEKKVKEEDLRIIGK